MKIENGFCKDLIEHMGYEDGEPQYQVVSFHLENVLAITHGDHDEDLGDWETVLELPHRIIRLVYAYEQFCNIYQSYMKVSRLQVGLGNLVLN